MREKFLGFGGKGSFPSASGSCGLSVLLSEEGLGRQERHLPTSR